MKNTLLLSAAAVLTLISLSSCETYNDGRHYSSGGYRNTPSPLFNSGNYDRLRYSEIRRSSRYYDDHDHDHNDHRDYRKDSHDDHKKSSSASSSRSKSSSSSNNDSHRSSSTGRDRDRKSSSSSSSSSSSKGKSSGGSSGNHRLDIARGRN